MFKALVIRLIKYQHFPKIQIYKIAVFHLKF